MAFHHKESRRESDMIDKGVVYAQNAKEQLDNARQKPENTLPKHRKSKPIFCVMQQKIKSQIIEEAKTAASDEAKKSNGCCKTCHRASP